MRLSRYLLPMLLCLLALQMPLFAADAKWNLVWQDDFDRVQVGPDWHVRGKASIENGRLLLEGGGATITTDKTFASDVRIEFDAEAQPGLPPCDLSATIGANLDHGYGYLFGFGARSNQANHLLGRGVYQVVENPPFLIEHGKIYHCVAQKEGRRLTYTVNGTKILDAESSDPLGGPGFDRVGMVTWAGMYVDNFKVYERATRHPDTPDYPRSLPKAPIHREGRKLVLDSDEHVPGLKEAVDSFNKGDLKDALERFRAMGPNLAGLVGQAYVLCDLGYDEKLQFTLGKTNVEFQKLADDFAAAAKADPKNQALSAYSRAAQSLPELIMSRDGLIASVRLVGLGEKNNPFYAKARLYEARYHYWNGAEAGSGQIKGEAGAWMSELMKTWPDNTILRQYTGENVPWGQELDADTDKYPAWAAYLREAYARQIRVMERFFTERQAPDGQLGGGYGDDVELMRTWMQIAAISSAAEGVRSGIENLASGVWDNEAVDGYSHGCGDVEHSAEPTADTFPTMLLVRYGDPLWVERNLQSCKTIHDKFMGIDNKGYPRFKSTEFGTDRVNTNPRAGGDTGYHARAMKHFIWQGWWGDPEATDWFARWCDGWSAATMAQIGSKIPGLPPGTIWYPSGDIFPPVKDVPWYDNHWNYYGGYGLGGMIEDSFLCANYLTGDPKYLRPFLLGLDYATLGPLLNGSYPDGSIESQRQALLQMADPQKTAIYKWLTGERVYDEYTLRFGDPAQIYRVDYDLDRYLQSFERAAKHQRNNLELQTTEVLSTDRAALGSALTVFGAYTGAVCGLRDAATPTFAVTYDTPDTDFAALVTESTKERVRVWLYSFKDKPVDMRLKFWQLLPGAYVVNQGELLSGEREFQHRYGWVLPSTTAAITHRADGVSVTVPPGKVWVVDLRLDQKVDVPKTAPDLAIAPRDLKVTDRGLEVTVHNIGNADSRPTTMSIDGLDAEVTVPGIPAPRNFTASSVKVTVPLESDSTPTLRVTLDPADEQYEICETNNTAAVSSAK